MTLIKNISGFRGTIGGQNLDNLTPVDIVKSICAFSKLIKENHPDLSSLTVITVKLDELGLFSLINLENAEIDITISAGVKFSRLFPPIVPLNPDIFFIKVIRNVNI